MFRCRRGCCATTHGMNFRRHGEGGSVVQRKRTPCKSSVTRHRPNSVDGALICRCVCQHCMRPPIGPGQCLVGALPCQTSVTSCGPARGRISDLVAAGWSQRRGIEPQGARRDLACLRAACSFRSFGTILPVHRFCLKAARSWMFPLAGQAPRAEKRAKLAT